MLSDYTAKNNLALQFLKSKDIKILKFPDEVLIKLKGISKEILTEISKTDSITQEVYNSYICLLYTSPSPRDGLLSRMPSSA